MEKVLFKRWIPAKMIKSPLGMTEYPDRGTRCWDEDFIHEGVFLQWGSACEETDNGMGTYTIALVRLPDGTVEEVLPTNVKFLECDECKIGVDDQEPTWVETPSFIWEIRNGEKNLKTNVDK
jgi:hypothetical protein